MLCKWQLLVPLCLLDVAALAPDSLPPCPPPPGMPRRYSLLAPFPLLALGVLLVPDLLMPELLLPSDLLQMPGLLLMVMRSSLSPPKLL